MGLRFPATLRKMFRWSDHMTCLLGSYQISMTGRSSPPEVFLDKDVLKICSKFTGEYPCRSVISVKLLCNFIEITFRYGRSPVNLLHIFRTPFHKNTYGGLFLDRVLNTTFCCFCCY